MEEMNLNQIYYEDIEEVNDDDIDMEYTAFENDYEMQEDIGVSHIDLDSFQFLSSTWYMFSHKTYIYMIQSIKNDIILTGDMFLDVDPQFVKLDRATNDMERKALKKWKNMKLFWVYVNYQMVKINCTINLQNIFILFFLLLRSGKKLSHCHILPPIHI